MESMETYRILRAGDVGLAGATDWDGPVWSRVETGHLSHFMGVRPDHFPDARFKVLHDDTRIHLLFRVLDRYVVGRYGGYQDPVCRDSCVEFFFYPGDSVTRGYFNLEISCRGTMLFAYQKSRNIGVVPIDVGDAARVAVAPSMGAGAASGEITEPLVWQVMVSMPKDLPGRYVGVPAGSRVWRVNCYKCADRSSHPHWLTWNRVDAPSPDFHRPESFGRFLFD